MSHDQTTSTCDAVIQLLLSHQPRLVIALVAVINLSVITAAFSVYHLVLAATNQTVNERYKRHYIACSQHTLSSSSSSSSSAAAAAESVVNCYDRGVVLNLCEEFFPLHHWSFHAVNKTSQLTVVHRLFQRVILYKLYVIKFNMCIFQCRIVYI